jgi:hypothetical protein
MKTCLFWSLIIALLCIGSCVIGYVYLYYQYPPHRWEPLFGKEINPSREQLGIPIIPSNWESFSVSQYDSAWRSPNCRGEKPIAQRKLSDRFEPCHARKRMVYWPENYPKEEQIPYVIEEIDTYFGPGYEDILGELTREYVNISCQYNPNDPTWKKCQAYALVANRFADGGSGKEVDLSTAVQILDEWGITYP